MINFKKITLTILVLGGSSLVAQAQDDFTDRMQQHRDSIHVESNFNALDYLWQPRYRYNEEVWENNSFWDHTYLQVGTGMFNIDAKGSSSLNFLQAMNMTLGHDFSYNHGARIGFDMDFSRSKNGGRIPYFKEIGVHADWLFNVSNYTSGYKKLRFIDVQTVIGVGAMRKTTAHMDGNGGWTSYANTSLEARLATEVRFRLGNRNYLALEPMIRLSQNKNVFPDSPDVIFDYGMNLNWGYYIHPDVLVNHPKENSDQLNPVFFELGVGPVFRHASGLNANRTLGPTYSLNVGKWMSPVWGVRGGVQFSSPVYDYANGGKDIVPGKSMGANLELLFNPLNLRSQIYDPDQRLGMFLFGGMTYGMNGASNVLGANKNSDATMYRGYTGGLNLWMRIDKNAQFFIEPRLTRLMYANNPTNVSSLMGDETLYSLMAGFRMSTYRVGDRLTRATQPFNKHYWFLQLEYGFGADMLKQWVNGESEKNWRGVWNLAVGRRWSGLSAARLALGQVFNMNHGNDYRESSVALEYMLNLNTLLNRYSETDRFNAWVYAGPYTSSFHNPVTGDNDLHLGAIGGFQFDYALSPTTSIYFAPEVTYAAKTSLSNHLNVDYKLGMNYRFDNGVNYDTFWNANTFFELGFGLEKLINSGENFGVSPVVSMGFGKWYDRVFGAKFNGWMSLHNSDYHCLHAIGMTADLMMDPISLFNSRYDRRTAKAGMSVLFGGSFGILSEKTTGDYSTHLYSGFNEGLQLWTRINPNTRLFVEGRYSKIRNGEWYRNIMHFYQPLDVSLGLAFDYDETGGRAYHPGRPGEADPTLEETLLRYKSLFAHKYWFIQTELGFNINASRQWNNGSSKQNWRGEWGTALGYRWSNLSAVRFALGQDFTWGREDYREITGGLEYMLNLNALMNHSDGADRLNMWVYTGPFVAAFHENGQDHFYKGALGGFQVDYSLNKTTSIYVAPEVRLKLSGTNDVSVLGKIGVSYRFDNGAHYDTFWNENTYMEMGAGVQKLMSTGDNVTMGPHVEFGFGKWYDRALGVKVLFNYASNNGDIQDSRTVGALTNLVIDPIGMLSSSYDRRTATAGLSLMLGGQFGVINEYTNSGYAGGFTHLYSGFNEGAQVWLRTTPTSRVYTQLRFSQIHTGNWTEGRFFKPLALTVGASFDYNATFMREPYRDMKDLQYFAQVGIGGVTRSNGHHNVFKSGLAMSVDLGIQTNSLHGARASFAWGNADHTTMEGSVAYQIDLLRMWQGQNSNKFFCVYGFVGPLAHFEDDAAGKVQIKPGFRLGSEFTYNLFAGTYLHITPEFVYYSMNGTKTWLRGTAGIGYRF